MESYHHVDDYYEPNSSERVVFNDLLSGVYIGSGDALNMFLITIYLSLVKPS